jgi:hypothetical protein
MLKDWFVFSNAVKTNVSRALFGVALTISCAVSLPSRADESAAALLSLPELELKVVQKNATGSQYQIGDRITIFVELKPDWLTTSPSFSIKLPDGASKLEDQGWYLDSQTLIVSNSLQFIVSPIQTGKLTLPTLLLLNEDKTAIARTSAFSIQVAGPAEKKEPSALIDPVAVSLATKYWILIGLVSALIIATSTYYFRRYLKNRKKDKPVILPNVLIDPEHVVAMKALDQLYVSYPYSQQNLKPVAFGISEILKHFFSVRFGIDANESTTDEMIALLRRESLTSDQLREVLSLFNDLDLIKFTKNEDAYHFTDANYAEFKIKAQSLIQKWANRINHHGDST